jgi:hypothetical protein
MARVPLHIAYAWAPDGDMLWVSRIPEEKGDHDWGLKRRGTPMEVAMPVTGVELRRFKADMKREGLKADSQYASAYGLSAWARQMRPDLED